MSRYAVVQHSGAGYKNDPTFAQGLETRAVTAQQAQAVLRRGGLVFDSYTDAEDYDDAETYPPGHAGLVPAAPGTFSDYKVDRLAVYVPATVNA